MITITASVIIRNLRNNGSSVLSREAPVAPPSPPVDRGFRDLPDDVSDQERQAYIDEHRRHSFGDPAPLEFEHTDAPNPSENRHGGNDQQDPRGAARDPAICLRLVARQAVPSLDVGPDAMADRRIDQRYCNNQHQAPDSRMPGRLVVQDSGDLGHRPEDEHVEDGKARPHGCQEPA
jgi:hypothetical protein